MEATMDFLADIPRWRTEKPYELFFNADGADIPASTCVFEKHSDVEVREMRAPGADFSLERDGFELAQTNFTIQPTSAEFQDPRKVQSVVLPFLQETQSFLKDHCAAEQVICFDWRLRVQGHTQKDLKGLDDLANIRNEAIRPAQIVHTDYSYDGGQFKVKQHLEAEEAKTYFDGTWKVRIINVWRPLVPVVQNFPLAFCHPCSVKATSDLVEKDNVHAHNAVGSLYLLHRPYHQWYYLPGQKIDQAWVFLSWDMDTALDEIRCPPHCSFDIPGVAADVPPRESVEVRFIVITKREE